MKNRYLSILISKSNERKRLMNRFMAALAASIILTTAVTAYAQHAPKAMLGFIYPPIVCADTDAVSSDTDIVVKLKAVEIYRELKKAIGK